MMLRKLENKKKQKRKEQIMKKGNIIVSLEPVDGARGVVLSDSNFAVPCRLSKDEFVKLVKNKAEIKNRYNQISKKIRLKSIALYSQIQKEMMHNEKYQQNFKKFEKLIKKIKMLTIFNDQIK